MFMIAYTEVNQLDKAEAYYNSMINKGVIPNVEIYNMLISMFSEANQLDEARNYNDEMINKGIVPTALTYNILIDVY